MSSLTWSVQSGNRRYVLKSVDAARYGDRFAAGLQAALRLSTAGLPAGAPVATRHGALTALIDDRAVALLEWVAGDPVDQYSPDGQALIGRTLARAHRLLGTVSARQQIEPALDPSAEHVGIRPWIRPTIARAYQALEAVGIGQLTWGHLHGDPSAGDFLRIASGSDDDYACCGLIDWGAYGTGPLVFDLASAVMYAGGIDHAEPLIAAHDSFGAMPAGEVERALGPLLGWRWASQAWYFARRIAAGDMTGISAASENETGLAHARTALAALGHA